MYLTAGSSVSGHMSCTGSCNLSGFDGDVSAVPALMVVRMVQSNVGTNAVRGSGIIPSAEMFHFCQINVLRVDRVLTIAKPNGCAHRHNPTAGSSVSGHMSCTSSGDLSGFGNLSRNGTSQQENGGNLLR